MVHSFDVKIFEFSFVLFCYSVVNVGSAFTEAQPGSSLTALCFEIVCSLLRKIVEREFQILTLMNFHEPLEIKCNFQQPSSSDSPLPNKTYNNCSYIFPGEVIYIRTTIHILKKDQSYLQEL